MYQCPECSKNYKSDGSLRRHIKYFCATGRPVLSGYKIVNNLFMCERCGKNYRCKGSVRRHLVYECGKAPTIKCPIEWCFYKCKIKNRMNEHLKIYDCGDNVVNYYCPVKTCEYRTKRKFDLKRHKLTKHKEMFF
ncbi:hypothetical protein BDFB_000077 [Asbolus verrucosus]|uniref:C2H2-type domain-containing protein n=1 Tax=Asbolus verrucosus TaxID=1661398 RepID=A0A482V7L0_ASBVE|nr:hypothetical protein BDFB_000077 [Asbolus verrucosus]